MSSSWSSHGENGRALSRPSLPACCRHWVSCSGLFVAFTAAQVWNDNDRANMAVSREASAPRAVVVLAASFPGARSTHAQLDPQEQLPTGTVAVAQRLDVRHLLPLLVEDHGLRPLWIEERFRRSDERLHEAAVEA